MTKMLKSELTAAVTEKSGVPQGTVEKVIRELVGVIAGELEGGNEVALRGLGTFRPHRSPVVTRSNFGGAPRATGGKQTVRFKVSASLKRALNEENEQ